MPSLPGSLRSYWLRIGLGALIVVIFALHAAGAITISPVNEVERNLYDMRAKWSAQSGTDDKIVILDIDEKSLVEFGRWPWNRARMAAITRKLFDEYGVAVLAFDVVWAESETEQWSSLLRDIGVTRQPAGSLSAIDTDRIFADSLSGRNAVLGYYFTSEANAVTKNALPTPLLSTDALPSDASSAGRWTGYTGNLASLMAEGTLAGHTNSARDVDGVIRRVPMLIRHGDAYYESLSLAVIRQLFGGVQVEPVIEQARGYKRVESLQVGPLRIPLDGELATFVTFRGPSHSFRYIPLGDVLAGRVSPDELAGKIALIGASAPGLGDNRATATDEIMPGVEVHANLIASMLDQTVREMPAYASGLDIAQVIVFGLAAVAILSFASPLVGLVAYIALSGLAVWLNLAAWSKEQLILPLATVLLTLGMVYVFSTAWGFLVEGRAKRQLGTMFGQYVPAKLVEQMARDPENYSMEGRDADLTVLFSDIRGFTTISEGLSAKELAAYINEYLTRMSQVIADHNGTLDKFIGDAIMAFWGAPVDDPDAARNAVKASLAMQLEADRLNSEFAERKLPTLAIGIGVNSGPMRVGDMGSRLRRAYTVMGDAVNLGSRLEGLTKEYGVGIIVGEGTCELLPDFTFRMLDKVRVKGKDKAVAIFEPIGVAASIPTAQSDEVARWNAMIERYFAADWNLAEILLGECRNTGSPAYLVDVYASRIAYNRAAPPPLDWDGVTTFKNK